MRYPTNWISITQGYHLGKSLDFGWCSHHNQNIYSCDDGVVYRIEKQPLGGNVIYIEHSNCISAYAHLSTISVKKGQKVKLGEKIGTMGKTGAGVTGEHLHFGLYSKGKNIYKNADLDPFSLCYVYPDQDISAVKETYRKKMKYYQNPTPTPTSYTPGDYKLLFDKAVRKSHNLGLNIYKVKDFPVGIRPYLTSNNLNADGKLKKGTDIKITEIYNEKGRIWGKFMNGWVVLQNIDGTKQATKIG